MLIIVECADTANKFALTVVHKAVVTVYKCFDTLRLERLGCC